MIMMKIQGGLGNQLFQYALGRHLALKNDAELKLDISWYATQTYRRYELDRFNIKENIATDKELRRFKKYQKRNRTHIMHNLLIADESKYIRERGYAFNPKILKIKDGAYLDGIWLGEKYFKDIEQIIRREFTLKASLPNIHEGLRRDMRGNQSVAICIRRGDFVTDRKVSSIHGLLAMDYYERAIKIIAEKAKDPRFFIFSDDIEWAKENLKIEHPVRFVSDGHKTINSPQELILMSECKHVISANSSFSWWGAWLNGNPDKIVIFPEKWFREESRNNSDLIPRAWLTIPNGFQ